MSDPEAPDPEAVGLAVADVMQRFPDALVLLIVRAPGVQPTPVSFATNGGHADVRAALTDVLANWPTHDPPDAASPSVSH